MYLLAFSPISAHAEKDAINLAFDALYKKALSGDVDAQYSMALNYLEGRLNCKTDTLTAEIWLKISAENGSAAAQYQLAEMYDYGKGVKQNRKEAIKWYKICALNDKYDSAENLKAKIMCANAIGRGLYGEIMDVKAAIKLMPEIPSGTYIFGSAKLRDKWLAIREGVLGDLYRLLRFEMYIQDDWLDATQESILHYKNSINRLKDWNKKFAVTESEISWSHDQIASSYYLSGEVLRLYNIVFANPPYYQEMMQFYQEAIDYGREDAKLVMGEFLLTGIGNISADPEKAISLLQPLVDKRIRAKILLAGFYYNKNKFRDAYHYYNDIANDKSEIDASYRADAYSHLAKMYRFGYGVKIDENTANDYLDKAAELGDADATYLNEINFFNTLP
jgi:TPR repeat protein